MGSSTRIMHLKGRDFLLSGQKERELDSIALADKRIKKDEMGLSSAHARKENQEGQASVYAATKYAVGMQKINLTRMRTEKRERENS